MNLKKWYKSFIYIALIGCFFLMSACDIATSNLPKFQSHCCIVGDTDTGEVIGCSSTETSNAECSTHYFNTGVGNTMFIDQGCNTDPRCNSLDNCFGYSELYGARHNVYNLQNTQHECSLEEKLYQCNNKIISFVEDCAALGKVCTQSGCSVGYGTPGGSCGISGDAYQIKKMGDAWNLNEQAADIDDSVTDSELDLLNDGTFIDNKGENVRQSDYTQSISFNRLIERFPGQSLGEGFPSMAWKFSRDTSGNRIGDPAGDYLFLSSNVEAWNYTLKITGSKILVKNPEDIIDTKILILNKMYTIIDVLLSGEYGNLDMIKLRDSSGNIITLEDGKEVEVNNEGVDGSLVYISGSDISPDVSGFKKLIISYTPNDHTWLAPSKFFKGTGDIDGDDNVIGPGDIAKLKSLIYSGIYNSIADFNDDGFVDNADLIDLQAKVAGTFNSQGESIVDPVFGAYQFRFKGLESQPISNTKIDIVTRIYLTMENKDGDLLDNEVICYYDQEWNKIVFGKDRNHLMAIVNEEFFDSNELSTLEGSRFLYNFNGESHIIEIIGIDTIDNKVDFKIVDTGEVYSELPYIDGQPTNFDFSLMSNFILTFDESLDEIIFDKINDDLESNPYYQSRASYIGKYGEKLEMEVDSDCSLNFIETNTNLEPEVLLSTAQIRFAYDSSIGAIKFENTGSSALGTNIKLKQKDDSSSYNYLARTSYGTLFKINTKNDGDLTIAYPQNTVTADVYVESLSCVSPG